MRVEASSVQKKERKAPYVVLMAAGIAMGTAGIANMCRQPSSPSFEADNRPAINTPLATKIEAGTPASSTPEPTADFRRFIKYRIR